MAEPARMNRRGRDGRASRAVLLLGATGAAIVALAVLMLWAYTDAPTGYTAEGPAAARRTVTGAAAGTGGAVSPAQDSGLRGTPPPRSTGTANP